MLNETDQSKFLGKYENATQLEEQVHTDVSEEYIKPLSDTVKKTYSLERKGL